MNTMDEQSSNMGHIPNICPESVRRHISNWEDAWYAFSIGHPLPPLTLRSGITVHHDTADPIQLLFYEIFITESYTGGGFYRPKRSDTVIDGGANIGLFSMYIASIAPGIQIHCFEPATKTRERLEHNIAANGLQGSIFVHPFALFGYGGKMALKHARSSGDYSFFDRKENKDQSEELVDCITLREAVDLCGADVIDLLKLDVEGAELDIVENTDVITWRRIQRVVVEYHDAFRHGCRKGVLDRLRKNGFDDNEISTNSKGSLGVIQFTNKATANI
jgi:31-O-methyltransferase